MADRHPLLPRSWMGGVPREPQVQHWEVLKLNLAFAASDQSAGYSSHLLSSGRDKGAGRGQGTQRPGAKCAPGWRLELPADWKALKSCVPRRCWAASCMAATSKQLQGAK